MTELDKEELALVEYEKQNELVDPANVPLDIKRILHRYYGNTLPNFTNKQLTNIVDMCIYLSIISFCMTSQENQHIFEK